MSRNDRRRLIPIAVLVTAFGCAAPAAGPLPAPVPETAASRTPHRVYDVAAERFIGFEALTDRIAPMDVVFFGELHNDPGTHQLQLGLLEALAGQGRDVVVSLEMFETDVQPVLDEYLAGSISEAEFLERSRPWPNYGTDYRPLVEFAKARGWPVLAANIPRRLAAFVARQGIEGLVALPAADRALMAESLDCPQDAYYRRFVEAVGGHPGAHGAGDQEAMLRRMYKAQCVKDETMAESIARAADEWPGRLIVHITGSFHSDYGQGIPLRLARRRPALRQAILTGIPTADLERPAVEEDRERADFLLFTLQPETEAARD